MSEYNEVFLFSIFFSVILHCHVVFAKILTVGRNLAEATDRVPIVVEEMTKSFVGWDTGEVDEVSQTAVGPVGVRIGVPMTVGPLGLSVKDVCGLGTDALPF